MFTENDLQSISKNYFIIYDSTPFRIIIESRNTGHWWWIEPSGFRNEVRLHHKHKREDTWHGQSFYGSRHTLSGAVNAIKEHDKYVLNGRV